jgi:hypothetical protein
MSKERLIQIIIKTRFGEHNDAKLYEPVSTDVLFLLQKFYDSNAPTRNIAIAMSKNDYIKYHYTYGSSGSCSVFNPFNEEKFDISFELKTLNEDGSPTKIKEWDENHCVAVLKIIDNEWWLKKHNMDYPF